MSQRGSIHARKIRLVLLGLLVVVLCIAIADLIGLVDVSERVGSSFQREEARKKRERHYDAKEYLPLTNADKVALLEGATISKEYQIKMQNFRFFPREHNVLHFLEQVSHIYGIPEILSDPGMESTRGQWTMDLRPCNKTRNYRLRRYYTGELRDTVTVDIKASSVGESPDDIVRQAFFLPNQSLSQRVQQKLEEDIHPCHQRWSMETRVLDLPFDYWLQSCSQCNELYPHCQPEHSLEDFSRVKPPVLLETWWWELEHHGTLFDGQTKYKTALTLIYRGIDEAIKGAVRPKGYSEWSIRVWSTDSGKGPWKRNVLEQMDVYYAALLEKFSDSPDFPCKDGDTLFSPRNFAFDQSTLPTPMSKS